MYLLDTNVISEIRKASSGRAAQSVVSWARAQQPTNLYISAITVFELETGTLLVERRDAKQGAILRHWLDNQVLKAFADRILPIDKAIAIRCAQFHVPDKRPERDALIAATAIEHGMTMVTRNVADFVGLTTRLLNPWEFKA